MLAQRPEEEFGVWPENWQAVVVFCALDSQWRVVALPGSLHMPGKLYYQGVEYSAVPAVMHLLGVPARDRRAVFADLMVLEGAARDALNGRPAA